MVAVARGGSEREAGLEAHRLGFGVIMPVSLSCRAGFTLPLQTHLHVGMLEAPHLSHRSMSGIRRVLHRSVLA